ncbi:MAG: cyclomaltodextrinase N-terminal domain-containing protein [Candidatus Marinimicrobia bacterium]|nr:cyclomaltodextrinase N-terminal domain-containing protein [Candidatus Neomarinimicrobiota bacterium]
MKYTFLRIFPLILLFSAGSLFSLTITKTEPPNWWSGMETDTVTLLVYGDDFSGFSAQSTGEYAEILEEHPYPNPAYHRVTLRILKSGTETITFEKKTGLLGKESSSLEFPIAERNGKKPANIDARDVIYLLIPDRFSDGNTERNFIPGHKDPVRLKHKWGRRGGDLQGVINHLDYLEDLGITVLWMTPVFENNYINCYHGYTPTDLYAIEPHLGDFETYRELIRRSQSLGIKVIMDHIINHISPSHPLAVNPPSSEWINYSVDDFEPCNYRISDVINTWGPDSLREIVQSGWFAGYLADMNLRHEAVVDYWITHAIWWIETFGLDGIRQDTWPYSDTEGAAAWALGVRKEYPDLFILGETMVFEKTPLSFFFSSRPDLQNGLSSITDFAHSSQIYQLTTGKIGIKTFYENLSRDFIYRNPSMMTVFMDNHDMGRFFTDTGKDIQTYLNAFALLYSLRGIPQIYYGDEIGMTGGHDPENRKKFPGGFPGDSRSAFTREGRKNVENLLYEQFRRWNRLRQEKPGLFTVPMEHILIEDSLYAAWRKDGQNILLLIYNDGSHRISVPILPLVPEINGKRPELISPLYNAREIRLDTRYNASVPAKTAVMWLFTGDKP